MKQFCIYSPVTDNYLRDLTCLARKQNDAFTNDNSSWNEILKWNRKDDAIQLCNGFELSACEAIEVPNYLIADIPNWFDVDLNKLDKLIHSLINDANPFWWGATIVEEKGVMDFIRVEKRERHNGFRVGINPIVTIKYGSPYSDSAEEKTGHIVVWHHPTV